MYFPESLHYRSMAHSIERILFIFGTAIDLWGLCNGIPWHFGILWIHTLTGAWSPTSLSLHGPQFNGSCSYLVQPLTLVGAWTLLDMDSLCSFSSILWHFEVYWIPTDWCLEAVLVLQPQYHLVRRFGTAIDLSWSMILLIYFMGICVDFMESYDILSSLQLRIPSRLT